MTKNRSLAKPMLAVVLAVVLVGLASGFALPAEAQIASSPSYSLESGASPGGGGEATSPTYSQLGFVGQPSPAGEATSPSYEVETITPVPEPAMLWTLIAGAFLLRAVRSRRVGTRSSTS